MISEIQIFHIGRLKGRTTYVLTHLQSYAIGYTENHENLQFSQIFTDASSHPRLRMDKRRDHLSMFIPSGGSLTLESPTTSPKIGWWSLYYRPPHREAIYGFSKISSTHLYSDNFVYSSLSFISSVTQI